MDFNISEIIRKAPDVKFFTTDGVSFPVNTKAIFPTKVAMESGCDLFDGKLNEKVFTMEKANNTVIFSIGSVIIATMIINPVESYFADHYAKLVGTVDEFGGVVKDITIQVCPVRPASIFSWYTNLI